MNLFRLFRRSTLAACALAVMPLTSFAAPAAAPVLMIHPYARDLDLSPVERLYHSAAYRVEVKPHGAPEQQYRQSYVFETRNDWVYRDFFNPDPARRGDVLSAAGDIGRRAGVPALENTGKADLRSASFTPFSFDGMAVDVRIVLLGSDAHADTAVVRPLRRQIATRISADGRSIELTMTKPEKLSVEINGRRDPLFLFADRPDVPDTSATYYYGPGVHRIAGDGTLKLNSGERVYIAAGAIVEGRFALADNSRDITIRGRGLLSGGEWPFDQVSPAWQYTRPAIGGKGSHHFNLEGITFVQSTPGRSRWKMVRMATPLTTMCTAILKR